MAVSLARIVISVDDLDRSLAFYEGALGFGVTWRGDAVKRGVELCGPEDTVIVTGKGHEPFLEIADEFIRYNDAPVMREAVEAKWGPVAADETGRDGRA